MTTRKPARTKRKVATVIKTRKEVVPDNSGQRQVRRRNTKSPRALKPKATGAGRDLWEGVVATAVKTRKLSPRERAVMDSALRRSVKVIAKAERVAGLDLWDEVATLILGRTHWSASRVLRAHFGKPREIYDVDDGDCWIIRKERAR